MRLSVNFSWPAGLYFAAFAALGLTAASLGPTLPGLAGQVQVSIEQISILFVTRSLGYLLGAFLVGRAYDRLPGDILMGLSLLLIAAAMGLVPFVGLGWILAVILLWVGFGEGSLDVGGNTLLVWRMGERVGPYMNALHFFFGAGAVMAPLLVDLAAGRGGIQLAYWLIATLIFPIGLAMFFLKSPPRPETSTVQESAAVNWAFILPVVLFFCVYVGAEVGFGGWIYSYALELKGSQELAARLNSAYWLAFTAGRLVVIPFSNRVPGRYLLALGTLGGLAAVSLILLRPADLAALWAGTLGLGLAIAPLFATMLRYAGERNGVSGRVNSYFFLGATSGGIFFPWLIGQFFVSVGPEFMPIVVWLSLAAALALLVYIGWLVRSSRQSFQGRAGE